MSLTQALSCSLNTISGRCSTARSAALHGLVVMRVLSSISAQDRLHRVFGHIDATRVPGFIADVVLWLDGALSISLRSQQIWNAEFTERFVKGISAIGRVYPTPVPKRAYRACLLIGKNGMAGNAKEGQDARLRIGNRPVLSFTDKQSKAEKFANVYQHGSIDKSRVIVSVKVDATNLHGDLHCDQRFSGRCGAGHSKNQRCLRSDVCMA